MGINNLSYEDAVKNLKDLSKIMKVFKRQLSMAKNVLNQQYVQHRIYFIKREINLLLSIIHAHKSARKLYAENQALRKELSEKK